jgi:serine/threonine-protein kinase
VHARHTASFDARVTGLDGKLIGSLKCQDISKGGCFLCTDAAAPAVFSKVKLMFPVAGDLECVAEVVRHVTKDQAKAWGMSPGFGVQFSGLTPAQKDAIGRVVAGLPAHQAPAPPKSEADDRVAEQVLAQYRKRINGDHYVVLALQTDAELSEVRARGREAKRELEGLRARPLSTEQKAQVDTALAKIAAAVEVLGTASRRIDFDANRGNYKGVARCIAAGLTVTEIEAVRAEFLKSHPGVESRGQILSISGNAFDTNHQLAKAVENYEEALTLDPLNLRYQQRYWALKRRNT